ncbi:unnamed protein product, partial [Urochloa humidicola]
DSIPTTTPPDRFPRQLTHRRTRGGEAGRGWVAARHIFDGHYRDGDRLLAVGLGNIICLWGANRDKVTKVCDLGEEEDANFVGWAQPGFHLTAGTKFRVPLMQMGVQETFSG